MRVAAPSLQPRPASFFESTGSISSSYYHRRHHHYHHHPMRAIYRVYPAETSPGGFTLFTPPESPDLDSTSDPIDNMPGFATAICNTCDKQLLSNQETCSTCCEPLQVRPGPETSFKIAVRPSKQLTPPPSQPSSPRRSLDEDEDTTQTSRRTRARVSYANEALSSAFSSQTEGTSLFPRSFYRPLERSGSDQRVIPRRTPSAASSETVTTFSSVQGRDSPVAQLSRPATPELLSTGYAPMSAGFARLGRKSACSSPDRMRRMRSTSARPSTELEARMFDGPA